MWPRVPSSDTRRYRAIEEVALTYRKTSLPQIADRNLDICVVGQLPATDLPLGDQFEPRPLWMVLFQAPPGRR